MKKSFTKPVTNRTARPKLVHAPAEPARMTLSNDLRQGIYQWFEALYQHSYDEHLEWMVAEAMSGFDSNPDDLPEKEMRKLAVEYVEPDEVIRSMMADCEEGDLESAIIEALLQEKGFVKCVSQHTSCTWERPSHPLPKETKSRRPAKRAKPQRNG